MKHIRLSSKIAVLVGVGLFVASAPVWAVTGIIGAVTLIATGTIGCIETEA
ncbi:MAG: hypothetical protein ACFWTN_07510 [Clostridium sp.]|jgi:hypothetical protein